MTKAGFSSRSLGLQNADSVATGLGLTALPTQTAAIDSVVNKICL